MADDDLAEAVKGVHRSFPTGVTIVTTQIDGQPYGLAVNAFSSISLEPPLVLVCVASSSSTYGHLFRAERMGVNVLAHDQAAVAGVFARSGGDKFSQVEWKSGPSGVPLLDGVSGYLELMIEKRIPAYTHTIFIGRVTGAHTASRPPLVYLAGSFFDGRELESALT
jgi:flavin reductase (DIM6/NTAB) family NADH-FMN oxidoreductase RutF